MKHKKEQKIIYELHKNISYFNNHQVVLYMYYLDYPNIFSLVNSFFIAGSTLRRVHGPLSGGLAMDVFEEHEGTHILQSLDGFAISLASDCRFLYISETVSIYLGLSQVGNALFFYYLKTLFTRLS